jgi:nucleoside-diphosphate-sugar epimerase
MTRLLITGGAGFIGARLARTLLARGTLAGRTIEQIVLADQFAPPEDLIAERRVQGLTGPLLEQCAGFAKERFDGVFHLASAVSGECELDSDPGKPLADVVADDTLPAPQTSYGAQKLMCEHLIADMTRKGFIDGRAARLMTVTVRPGKPNAAASSFFSGVIREPLAGVESICPVDATVSHPVASPARTIEALIAVYEATREQLRGRLALNLPALNVTVQRMLDALEAVAGPKVRALVKFQRDERIAGIVANWPKGASAARANALGLTGDASFEDIVRQYIADCRARPDAHLTLKGLDS